MGSLKLRFTRITPNRIGDVQPFFIDGIAARLVFFVTGPDMKACFIDGIPLSDFATFAGVNVDGVDVYNGVIDLPVTYAANGRIIQYNQRIELILPTGEGLFGMTLTQTYYDTSSMDDNTFSNAG